MRNYLQYVGGVPTPMSAAYIILPLAALMEELPLPSTKAWARARSAAAIVLIPLELNLTVSLRAAVLDNARE
jgi:uncharacterized membrane protein